MFNCDFCSSHLQLASSRVSPISGFQLTSIIVRAVTRYLQSLSSLTTSTHLIEGYITYNKKNIYIYRRILIIFFKGFELPILYARTAKYCKLQPGLKLSKPNHLLVRVVNRSLTLLHRLILMVLSPSSVAA